MAIHFGQTKNTDKLKKLIRYSLCSLFFLLISAIVLDQSISWYVRKDVYTKLDQLPYRPYALVLGTARYIAKNTPNLYYQNRMIAAKTLFKAKKIDYLLLSGDNRTFAYNEPRMMFQDLRKMDIPEDFMYMDFAGFRTLDSVIRAEYVFKATPMVIVSQKFHCERALLIAKFHHIDAICFAADYPPQHFFVRVREVLARIKAVWDLLTEKEPHFLGQPEPLPVPAYFSRQQNE